MLSGSAFNALLKTLEEPPAHVVFILATTELHKLPATIISRCQRFDFRRIATPVLRDRLLHIAKVEGITLDEEAATLLLSKSAKNYLRGQLVALTILDAQESFLSDGSCCRMTGQYACTEMIGREQGEQIGDFHGKTD